MAYTAIGLGTTANDGTGDTLRTAGTSINANFVEIYTALGTGSALTTGITADATGVVDLKIKDTSADHLYIFAVSELADNRTVTLPLLSGDDEFTFNAHTQTLTNKTLTSPVLNTSVSGSAFLDDDTFGTATSSTLASSESIKAYVDAQIATEDTLDELNDTTIATPAGGHLLLYDGTDSWDNKAMSGDATIDSTGAATIANDAVTAAKLYNEQVLVVYASSPTTATANVNGTTSSTTTLVVDGNSGTIATGMVVSGSGVSGTPTVVTVTDQNNLVLSHAQSLTNDVALTFTATLKVLRTAGD